MKILHTSDLHLREVNSERWNALQTIVETADDKDADILTIAGDLFDRDVHGEQLRSELRSLFTENTFEVVLVSGNHDVNSFREGLHFGDNVTVITDHREAVRFEDLNLRLWGLPHENISHEKTYTKIQSMSDSISDDTCTDCLLYHGNLVLPSYQSLEFGDEGKEKYMPVKLSYFDDTGFDYVLGGHYHARSRSHAYEGGTFLYPGAPTRVSGSEIGPRHAYVIQSTTDFKKTEIKVPYYENIVVKLEPDYENPTQEITDSLSSLDRRARPVVTITGFFDGKRIGFTEKELKQELKDIVVGDFGSDEYNFECQDVSTILDSELYGEFIDELDDRDLSEDRHNEETIRDIALQAMMKVYQ